MKGDFVEWLWVLIPAIYGAGLVQGFDFFSGTFDNFLASVFAGYQLRKVL